MLELIEQWLTPFGLGDSWTELAARAVLPGAILALGLVADFIAHRIVVRTLSRIIRRTRWHWKATTAPAAS